VLALLAPLLALKIENLERLQASLDDINNLHSDDLRPDEEGENMRQNRASDTQRTAQHSWPKDCSEIPADSPSGIYVIQPTGLHPIVVYCEMDVTGGGWTVIQRNHQSTEITWAESWSTYKYGFGNVHTEYWLGTEYIHQISRQKVYQVRFVIWNATNNMTFADYNLFSLEDESHGYRLRLGTYSGTAGDSMTTNDASTVHDNMKFSAKDQDQDTSTGNCASSHGGGWWYSACYSVQLNVKGGITWGSLCNGNCKASAILLKPAPYC
ncbi:FGL1L protein, partial [Rynchops niger]|nr:FGL1L protein [Rynchops niger]